MKKPGITPSKLYIAGVRRLHFLVLMAVLVPFFCQIATLSMPAEEAAASAKGFLPLYFITLTIAFIAVLFYLLQETVSSLGFFLLSACPPAIVFLVILFSCERALGISVSGAEQVPQSLIVLLYLLDAIRMRTNDNSRKKAKAQEDHSWTGDFYLLPLPALQFLAAFALLYIIALFFHSHELAVVALTGAMAYFFLVFPYLMLVRREEFLEERHSVNRIPTERIAVLQRTSMLRVLVPCTLLSIAALMTSAGRRFLDMPKIRIPASTLPPDIYFTFQRRLYEKMIETGLFEEGAPPPKWIVDVINFIENMLSVVMLCLAAYLFWRAVLGLVRIFRKDAGEETLTYSSSQTHDEHISLKTAKRARRFQAPLNPVRRRYKKTILHYRGEAPGISETPAQMEALAGLPDTEQMHELHDSYETVRYARPDKSRQT